jgi:hypothetical protein
MVLVLFGAILLMSIQDMTHDVKSQYERKKSLAFDTHLPVRLES